MATAATAAARARLAQTMISAPTDARVLTRAVEPGQIVQPVRPLSLPLRRRSHAERSASTRAQLLGAAADLVRDGGVQAASMFEVAKAAGVTPGALQHHFGSKAELMMQVIEHILRSDDASGVAWPAPSMPLARRCVAFVDALWATAYAPRRFITAWAIYFGSQGDPDLMQRIGVRRELAASIEARCRLAPPARRVTAAPAVAPPRSSIPLRRKA